MTTRTAGPDYWFVDPAYDGIDRLTDDECPMDEMVESEEREADEFAAKVQHTLTCAHSWAGMHLPENCPAGGV